LYENWRNLQKDANKTQEIFEHRRNDFVNKLDYIFDIAHASALELMKLEEDKIFLQRQREPGRPGSLGGVDRKFTEKEKRAIQRAEAKENRRQKIFSRCTTGKQ
jgi:adenylate/nucleoside-diphosphate kinase